MWRSQPTRTGRCARVSTADTPGATPANTDPMDLGNFLEVYGANFDGRRVHHRQSDSSYAGQESIRVTSIDYRVPENSKYHHTDKFELTESRYDDNGKKQEPQLVLRRGASFDIDIVFDKPYRQDHHDISLVLEIGPQPLPSKGTSIEFLVSAIDKEGQWGAKIYRTHDNQMSLSIIIPPKCIVGKWELRVDTVNKDRNGKLEKLRYIHPAPIYILFNPWCKEDTVYMDDPSLLEEYVLKDIGKVYRGTAKQPEAKAWNYGQFEDFMLDCIFYLMDKSGLNYPHRANPIKVSRKLTQMCNSDDDGGLLEGNWSGKYHGGKPPGYWAGSVKILDTYWKTKKPIKFGQCWVFSGCIVTMCRALGIPCRSITTYSAAADTDGSVTIDSHFDAEGFPIEKLNEDSIWNYHVWNDVWMARPDLPYGYGGWQAIDGTNQEVSEGVYQLGPCSLVAIKNGVLTMPFDSAFVFAEVNADQMYWLKAVDGSWKNTIESRIVGKKIVTKKVGDPDGSSIIWSLNEDPDMEDITNQYKWPEGSAEERAAVIQANNASTKPDLYAHGSEEVQFKIEDKNFITIGNPFDIPIKMTNTNKTADRTVHIRVTVNVVYYTGVTKDLVKSQAHDVKLGPGQSRTISISVNPDMYMDKIVEQAMFKVKYLATVLESQQIFATADDFRLRRPDLSIDAPDNVKVGQEFQCGVSFTNPVPKTLTRCEFTVEGPGLKRPTELAHNKVSPQGRAFVSLKLCPKKPGRRYIVASFDCEELPDISGYTTINVTP